MIRFVIGGSITLAAGFIAKIWGPVIGGLFLAFPAIFPAQATLIARHEEEKKALRGMSSGKRGRKAAALDGVGTALGSIGLVVFAALTRWLLPLGPPLRALAIGMVSWFLTVCTAWFLWKHRPRRRKRG